MRNTLLATVAIVAIAAGGGYYAYSTNADVKSWVDTQMAATGGTQSTAAAEGQNRELPPPPPSAGPETRTLSSTQLAQAEIPAPESPAPMLAPQGPMLPLDVDALIARLPPMVKATYANKTYDPATGVTTVEGLEFTFVEEAGPGRPLEAPVAPQWGTPAPETAPPTPPATPQGFEAAPDAGPVVTPINLAPPFPDQPAAAPAEGDEKIIVARMTSRGLDVAAFEKVMDAANYAGPRDPNFLPLLENVTLEGVRIINEGTEVAAIGAIELAGLQMKQFDFVPGGDNFEAQFVSDDLAPLQMIGTVLDSLRFAGIAVRGLALNEAVTGMVYNWDNYEIREFDRGRIGPVMVKNLVQKLPDPTTGMMFEVKVGESWGDGMDFSGAVPFMTKAMMPPTSARDLISYGRSQVKDMVYAIPEIFTMTVPTATSEPGRFTWLIPSDIVVKLDGTLSVNGQNPDMAEFVTMMGQSEFPLSMALDWKYDDAAGNASLKQLYTYLGGLYGLDIAFSFGGLELAKFDNPAFVDTMDQSVVLNSVTMKLIDDGGTAKSLNLFAQQSGITAEQAREMVKGQITMMTVMVPEQEGGKALKPIADAISAFVENPGVLTIALLPPTPLSLQVLQQMENGGDPVQMIQQLGLTASAGPK